MELSFNDKITSKLQNYSFKLNWICLLVKNNYLQTTKHLKNCSFKVLTCYFNVSLN